MIRTFRYLKIGPFTVPLFIYGDVLIDGGITVHRLNGEIVFQDGSHIFGKTTSAYNCRVNGAIDTFKVKINSSKFFSYTSISSWKPDNN